MAVSTDVLVIGAGPGGYVAAIQLGKLGKKVVLVDRDRLGGECLNYGCIPSKALIHVASLPGKAKKGDAFGFDTAGAHLDWAKVQTWKNGVISGLNRGVAALEKANGVTVLSGSARLVSANEARITTPALAESQTDETVTFAQAILVTGSRPIEIPGFAFDGKDVLSSKEALDLAEAPARLLVIGGGVIGLEIGTVFAKLGSKVTVVELMPQILPGIESDMIAPVNRNLGKLGFEILLGAKAKGMVRGATGPAGSGLQVTVETPQGERVIEADKILLSVGRSANSRDLGLAEVGIATDARGHIAVNAHYQTSLPNIYAAGDVVGGPYLAHKASREGVLAALHIAGRVDAAGSAGTIGAIPWVVFTDPEIAFVGLSETDAKARGIDVVVGRFPFSASGRAQAVRDTDGFVKMIADKHTHRVLGVGIVGPAASDLIGEACLAVGLGATVHQIASIVHPHPTLCEAFAEAAEACLGQAIHLMPPPVRAAASH